MSYFDEQPDGDIHGECAHEIARLEAENANFKRQDRLQYDARCSLQADLNNANESISDLKQQVAMLKDALNC